MNKFPFPTPQPLKGVLAMRRITIRALAADYGCTETYAGQVVNGRVEPSERFRRFVSEKLGVPEGELFRPVYERVPA